MPCSWQPSFYYTDAFATRRPHSQPPPTLRCVITVSRCAGIRREENARSRANGTTARATHLYRSAYTYYKSASDTQPNLNFVQAWRIGTTVQLKLKHKLIFSRFISHLFLYIYNIDFSLYNLTEKNEIFIEINIFIEMKDIKIEF